MVITEEKRQALIAELRKASESYRSTLLNHMQNPKDFNSLVAWDTATSEFNELINNDEINIISALLDCLNEAEGQPSKQAALKVPGEKCAINVLPQYTDCRSKAECYALGFNHAIEEVKRLNGVADG